MRDSPAAVARARWAVAAVFFLNGAVIGTWAAQIPLLAIGLAAGITEPAGKRTQALA